MYFSTAKEDRVKNRFLPDHDLRRGLVGMQGKRKAHRLVQADRTALATANMVSPCSTFVMIPRHLMRVLETHMLLSSRELETIDASDFQRLGVRDLWGLNTSTVLEKLFTDLDGCSYGQSEGCWQTEGRRRFIIHQNWPEKPRSIMEPLFRSHDASMAEDRRTSLAPLINCMTSRMLSRHAKRRRRGHRPGTALSTGCR